MSKHLFALIVLCALSVIAGRSIAGYPEEARYTDDDSKVFWFVQISDTHIGQDLDGGVNDTDRLSWITGSGYDTILPEFIVVTGDLTDSTDGLLIPMGPYQDEWESYRSIVIGNGMNEDIYFDLPGNHDQYNDGDLAFYKINSVQGAATGMTQQSWTLDFGYGEYHFMGVATCGNDGWPWPFDNTGLDSDELDYVEHELDQHSDARLTFFFGHHPTSNFLYGESAFVNLMRSSRASVYAYGHTHDYDVFRDDEVLRFNLRSLAKSDDNHFVVFAVDNDGLSLNVSDVDDWPLVVITAPLDADLGGSNPYAYPISADYDQNPVRALVFDSGPVSSVQYRVAGGTWTPMTFAGDSLWKGTFDATSLPTGDTQLEVKAIGGRTHSQSIVFNLQTTACYDGIDNDGDTHIDWPDDPGCYSPSDTDEGGNAAPVADAGGDQIVGVAAMVTLDGAASYDPEDLALTYSWDFDASDGITADATDVVAYTAYAEPGRYTVTLTVTDNQGLTDTDTAVIRVLGADDDSADDVADDAEDDSDDDYQDDDFDDATDDTGDDDTVGAGDESSGDVSDSCGC